MQERSRWMVLLVFIITTLMDSFSAEAAQIESLTVRCDLTRLTGSVEVSAPYVRIQVSLASDVTQILAEDVVNVRRDGSYGIALHFDHQAENTLLIISVGEWDGQQYINPARMVGYYCNQAGGTPSTDTIVIPPDITVVTGADCYALPFAPGQSIEIDGEGVVLDTGLGIETRIYAEADNQDDVVGILSPGTLLQILSGPYCAYYDDLGEQVSTRRWLVDVNGQQGWLDEYVDLTLSGQGFVYFFGLANGQSPTPVPTEPSSDYIAYFYADQYQVAEGEGSCAMLYYWAVGAQSLRLLSSNWTDPLVNETLNADEPNQYEVCPYGSVGQNVLYTLEVTYVDGSLDSRSITIEIGFNNQSTPTPVPSEAGSNNMSAISGTYICYGSYRSAGSLVIEIDGSFEFSDMYGLRGSGNLYWLNDTELGVSGESGFRLITFRDGVLGIYLQEGITSYPHADGGFMSCTISEY